MRLVVQKARDHWTANFRQNGDGLLARLANLPHLPLNSFFVGTTEFWVKADCS